MRNSKRLIFVALLACVLMSAGAALAATAPRGALTKAEYSEIRVYQSGYQRATRNAHPVRALTVLCDRLKPLTPLAKAMRSRCVVAVQYVVADQAFNASAKACEKLSTQEAALDCLAQQAQALRNAQENVYLAVSSVDRAARARRLKTACVDVLGAPRADLTAMTKVAEDLEEFASALRTANTKAVLAFEKRFLADVVTETRLRGPTRLSLCAHE